MESRDAGREDAGAHAREGRLGVGLLVAVTLALQGVSWWILEGYQVADSVEFVENAQALVRGHEVLDSQAIRSAFFPLLLSPPLLLADLLGLEDQRPLFWLMRLVQMGIGVAVVLAAARLARRVAGRGAGLLAGWTVAVNPVFLQYTVSPLTDVLAALLVTLGLVALADLRQPRRGLWGGVWLGLAVMVSYKTLAMAAAAVAVLMRAGGGPGSRPSAGSQPAPWARSSWTGPPMAPPDTRSSSMWAPTSAPLLESSAMCRLDTLRRSSPPSATPSSARPCGCTP